MIRLLFCFTAIGLLNCHSKPSTDDLRKRIASELGKNKGVFAVAFKDMATGEELLINEHQLFHAASIMKVPVMVEAYKQAAEGDFLWMILF